MKSIFGLSGTATPWCLVGAISAIAICGASTRAAPPSDLKPVMHRLGAAAVVAYRGLVMKGSTDDATVQGALSDVRRSVGVLRRHARTEEPGFGFYARSVEADARRADTLFRKGDRDGAGRAAGHLLTLCVRCHSRLPAEMDAPALAGLVGDDVLKELPALQQGTLLLAARRFHDGLTAYEKAILDPALEPDDIVPALIEYLTVVVRVERDVDRVASLLKFLLSRDDLSKGLKADLEVWQSSLAMLRGTVTRADRDGDVRRARRLIQDAELVEPVRGDRTGAVHYVVASGVLHRAIDRGRLKVAERAEAYLLLGVAAEHLTPPSSQTSEAPSYFEACVRTDPGGGWAGDALVRLREHLTARHAFPHQSELPADVEAELDGLELLIKRARPARP